MIPTALPTSVPVAGWICAASACGGVVLLASAVVRRHPPVDAAMALGALVGAAAFVALPEQGAAFRMLEALLVAAAAWSGLSGLLAPTALRPREPARPTPGRAAATLGLVLLASIPVVIVADPVVAVATCTLPTGVAVLALRDSERLAAARRDLGLLQLAAAGVLVVGLSAGFGRESSYAGPRARDLVPLVYALPTLVLAVAAVAWTGPGPLRRAAVRVLGPAAVTVVVGLIVVAEATRVRRALLAYDRTSLPELRALDGSPLRGHVPLDACVRASGAPRCGPVEIVVAPSDRPVSRELTAVWNDGIRVRLAVRPSDPLGGRVAATGIQIGKAEGAPKGHTVVRDGAGYRVRGVAVADLEAAAAASSGDDVELCSLEDWTAGELVRLCADGCRLH